MSTFDHFRLIGFGASLGAVAFGFLNFAVIWFLVQRSPDKGPDDIAMTCRPRLVVGETAVFGIVVTLILLDWLFWRHASGLYDLLKPLASKLVSGVMFSFWFGIWSGGVVGTFLGQWLGLRLPHHGKCRRISPLSR